MVAYAILAIYNVSVKYAMEEMKKDIVWLEKENTQLYINQTQSNSLDHVLDKSEKMLYTEVNNISYIERPSTSPFAVLPGR